MPTIRLVGSDPPTMLVQSGTKLAPVDVACCCPPSILPEWCDPGIAINLGPGTFSGCSALVDSATYGPFAVDTTITFTGHVDDDVRINGVIVQEGEFPFSTSGICSENSGKNGAHDFSYFGQLPAGTPLLIELLNNFDGNCFLNGTLKICPPGCGCAEALTVVESLNQLDVSVHFYGSDTCNDIDITLSNTWFKTDLEPLPYNTFKFTCLSLGYIYFRSFPVDYTSPVEPDPGITCHAGTPDSGNAADFEISLTPNNPPMDCTNALLSVAVSVSRECHIGGSICDVSFFENSPGLVIPWADLLGTHYISFVNNAYVTGSTTVDLTLTFS